jgi:tripartite-type tricarboxylate transporter receptor subunit TctC
MHAVLRRTAVRLAVFHVTLAGAFAAISVLPLAASAQSYPSKPLRLIVPLAPGGSSDNNGRITAEKLSQQLGQPIVVENRVGAATDVGIGALAKSPPDGYTLGVVPVGSVAIGTLVRKLPYDPLKDIAPVSGMSKSGLILVANASSPFRTVADVIAYAKQKPGALTFGSIGIGSTHHLAGELLKQMAGIDMLHVPFKGASESNLAVISGQIDLSISGASSIATHVRAGKMRALASTGPARVFNLPEVPTVGETLPGFSAGTGALSIFTSGGTPKDIVGRLNADMRKALADPDLVKRFANSGEETDYKSAEELAAELNAEIRKWTELVRGANLKLN